MRSAPEPHPELLLHHDIHAGWNQCRLVYWALGFSPVYPAQAVIAKLRAVMDKYGIGSYLVYELLGDWDVLVRAWVPWAVVPGTVGIELSRELSGLRFGNTVRVNGFEVKEIVRHWLSGSNNSSASGPNWNFVKSKFTPEFISDLNEGLELGANASPAQSAALRKARLNGVLFPYPPLEEAQEGIKFVMFIATEGMTSNQTWNLKRSLAYRLDQLTDLQRKGEAATELALYFTPGHGGTDFIVVGRAYAPFFYGTLEILHSTVIDPVLRPTIRARPYTHVLGRVNFADYREELTVPPPRPDADINTVLEEAERSTLEFKPSAYLDYVRWIGSGETPTLERELFVDGVVRTVAGYLNSPPLGGLLVLGALNGLSLLQETLNTTMPPHPQERLDSLPKVGKCFVTGLEADMEAVRASGKPCSDIQDFGKILLDELEHKLAADVRNELKIEVHTIQGRSVIALRVRPAAPTRWTYFDDVDGAKAFVVRVGYQTARLDAEYAARYQAEIAKSASFLV